MLYLSTGLTMSCYADVVVVGAGPTGLACGIELKKRGVSAMLIDKGCVVNSLYHYPTHMTFFTTPELLEIGDIPMTSINEKPTPHRSAEILSPRGRTLQSRHPPVRARAPYRGDGRRVRRGTEDRDGCPHAYPARKIILATGYYDRPNRLDVPGEDLAKVIHYYKEPHPYYDQDVLVVGGEEFGRHRGAGTVLDRRACHAGASRRRSSTTT